MWSFPSPVTLTEPIRPHNTWTTTRGSPHRHRGHQISQSTRPRIEEPFGWIKTVGGGRKLRYKGRDRNRAWFKMTTAVYNVIRITALDTQRAIA